MLMDLDIFIWHAVENNFSEKTPHPTFVPKTNSPLKSHQKANNFQEHWNWLTRHGAKRWCTDTSKWATNRVVSHTVLHFLYAKFVPLPCPWRVPVASMPYLGIIGAKHKIEPSTVENFYIWTRTPTPLVNPLYKSNRFPPQLLILPCAPPHLLSKASFLFRSLLIPKSPSRLGLTTSSILMRCIFFYLLPCHKKSL